MSNALRLRAGLAGLIPGLILGLAQPASAHSELRRSSPTNGAVLATPPSSIELAFNEKVQLTALRLYREGAAEIALPRSGAIFERDVAQRTLPQLAPGAYTAEWRAISADGHAIGGVIRFRVEP